MSFNLEGQSMVVAPKMRQRGPDAIVCVKDR